jgi:DNA-binding NarL/FixJ family response regulator
MEMTWPAVDWLLRRTTGRVVDRDCDNMPGMDGFETTIAIREQEKTTGVHQSIVAMTALLMKGDRERCLDAGMDGYISKPIDLQQLDDVLDACSSSRLQVPSQPDVKLFEHPGIQCG